MGYFTSPREAGNNFASSKGLDYTEGQMRGAGQFERPQGCEKSLRLPGAIWLLTVSIAALTGLPAAAQYPGPPARTTVGGHFLAPPPSVTSLAGRYLPPPLPSVTSIPNYGYTRWSPYAPYYNGRYGRRGYGYGQGGVSYAVPYYIPMDGYGYDYVGGQGPELYSGPPVGPNDPILHMVVEQPAVRYPSVDPDLTQAPAAQLQPAPQQQSAAYEAKPNEPSVLIFRDGHKREVSNYAIMGGTVYVFDKGTQNIALADLDVPATIMANDDRGLEFKIPVSNPGRKNSDLQQKSAPDKDTTTPADIAAVLP